MKKATADPKVKKTYVRNCELKSKSVHNVDRVLEVRSTHSAPIKRSSQKENDLKEPSICSSEVLANYLSDIRQALPTPLSAEDLNVESNKITSKVTKKLNFHFNDKMYKNLVELNANVQDLKTKRDKKPTRLSSRKDLEPKIEDFFEDRQEEDSPPEIPIIKPHFKPIKYSGDSYLLTVIDSFDDL